MYDVNVSILIFLGVPVYYTIPAEPHQRIEFQRYMLVTHVLI